MTNNPKNRQKWIFDLLKVDELNYVDTWAKFGQKWAKGKTTFDKDWNTANSKFLEYQRKVNKAKEEASITIEVNAVKQGLKLKIDRLMFYQNQIDIMEQQLIGSVKFFFIVGNKPVSSHNSKGDFVLPLEKQNEIRKQIHYYQSEISKIEGDYATIKNDLTTNGQSLNPTERDARIAQLIAKATKQE
jgi:hypothetical protein